MCLDPANRRRTRQRLRARTSSGGDDPTFINDMAQWINAHNVFNATFWDYGSSLLTA